MHHLSQRIAVARGEAPADAAICNAQVFNAFTGEFALCDVLLSAGHIACVLPAGQAGGPSPLQSLDAGGRYLVPGFIDAHVHIESSHLCPEEFLALAASNGVSSVVADPHEVCNVMGTAGLDYMLEASEGGPARAFFMLPSCVPASPLEEAAHTLTAGDLAPYLERERVLGLGEMMNYPGVYSREPGVMEKLGLLDEYNARRFGPLQGKSLDGHAPMAGGRDLQAYLAAGISSDHEAGTAQEARERLEAGMGLMLREGSSAKNLLDLVPGIAGNTVYQCMLCTDDRHAGDLMEQGSINYLVRLLVRDGRLPLADILRMAGYNTARHFGLKGLGAIAPGWLADFALYPDLESWRPDLVWCRGRLVAEGGRPVQAVSKLRAENLRGSVRLAPSAGPQSLKVPDQKRPVRVIGALPRQIVTRALVENLPGRNGLLEADPALDIAKAAVFERHRASGRVGLGFVRGLGLGRGALASTVSHDSHNLIVLGMNDEDMWLAVSALREAGGGQAVCAGGQVKALLPLPLAGIFSDAPLAEMLEQQERLHAAVRELGLAPGMDPFMTLAFISLGVIPSLRLTDGGLVDVEAFKMTGLYV